MSKPLIIAVIGSRGFYNYQQLESEIDSLVRTTGRPLAEIVSGGAANSADTLAERYAHARGIAVRIFLPDYAAYGRRAPLVRNELIIRYLTTTPSDSSLVLAFWDGKSKGTANALGWAKKLGVRRMVVVPLP